jgi:4-hydroxy-2-oxoheptanedioate aldolase
VSAPNRVKRALAAGERVFGTWSNLSSPTAANVAAHGGVDFVILDLEHAPTSLETVEQQVYAAEAGGATPIVRLGHADAPTILRVLDLGAQSLLVSHVSDADEAAAVVRAARYAPDGDRGLSPFTRHHGYSDQGLPDKLSRANEETFVGVLVEGERGLANLAAIAATPGLDLVYLGVYDLSQTVGAPGDLRHPRVVDAVREAVGVVEAAGPAVGSVAPDRDYLELLAGAGVRFLSYRVDSAILRDGLTTARRWYEELPRQS